MVCQPTDKKYEGIYIIYQLKAKVVTHLTVTVQLTATLTLINELNNKTYNNLDNKPITMSLNITALPRQPKKEEMKVSVQ